MRITRKGYYEVYAPDGTYISRHTSRDESYEAVTENGQEGVYTITCPNREVEVLLGVINQGGGSAPVGGGYTATHYAAPFASVSGASSDYDLAADGATAFASATSIGSPCTIEEAMQNATAGDVVEFAAGVYSGLESHPATTWQTAFTPVNSGTLANPIIFYAVNPAAYNYGSTALYAEIRRTDGTVLHAAMGSDGNDHVIFDGFYSNEVVTKSAPAKGVFQLHDCTGSAFRRCAFDRGNTYIAGYSVYSIFIQDTIDSVVSDCFFNARPTYAGNPRSGSNITVYNSENYLLEYNEHSDYLAGQHIKENDFGSPYITSGIQRYNKLYGGDIGIIVQQGVDNEIHNNLIYNPTAGSRQLEISTGPDRAGSVLANFHHNTIVADSTSYFFWIASTSDLATSIFQDNICYAISGHSGEFVTVINNGATLWAWTDWTIDNNCYYTVDGTLDFTDTDFSGVSGIANWRTATSQEANTITSDPEFTAIGSNDYTLASNGQAALTASSTSGPVGCYVTGSEEIGLRASPTY